MVSREPARHIRSTTRACFAGALLVALAGCVDVPDWSFEDAQVQDADRRPPPDMDDLPLDVTVMDADPADAAPDSETVCVRTDELCNGRDDDCDGAADEDFDLDGDPDNCGGCGLACRPGNAEGACALGTCTVARCAEGFADIDGDPVNGCEYGCPGPVGDEVCNGVDDDCDARTDEQIDARLGEGETAGVCLGTPIPCLPGGTVGEPDFAAIATWQPEEDRCDGLDNDCDGAVDEAQPNVGEACAVGLGICARAGTRVCADDGVGDRCDVEPGEPVPDVLCDGLDADCDGLVDEGIAGCVQCDGRIQPPCNGCPDSATVPAGWVCVRAGRFDRGSPPDERGRLDREGPQHTVRITRPFLIQSTEVTRRDWRAVFEDDPSFFDFEPRRPVERVNWFEAVAYANALSAAEGREQCYVLEGCNAAAPGAGSICVSVEFAGVECEGYRLPTDAEWAYAARAGSQTRFWFGDADAGLAMTDFYSGNGDGVTHEVGQLSPNPWGLYDVHGNVWEWVHDGAMPYEDVLEIDPTGDDEAEERIRRGGSLVALPDECRSAAYESEAPNTRSSRGGFRLVRTLP